MVALLLTHQLCTTSGDVRPPLLNCFDFKKQLTQSTYICMKSCVFPLPTAASGRSGEYTQPFLRILDFFNLNLRCSSP